MGENIPNQHSQHVLVVQVRSSRVHPMFTEYIWMEKQVLLFCQVLLLSPSSDVDALMGHSCLFWLRRYGLPHMKEGSSIVNSASVNAYKGNASLIGYSTTKGAIIAFTRSLALSIVGRGIRVNGKLRDPLPVGAKKRLPEY